MFYTIGRFKLQMAKKGGGVSGTTLIYDVYICTFSVALFQLRQILIISPLQALGAASGV